MKLHGLKPVVSYRQLLLLTNSIHALKYVVLSLAIIKKHAFMAGGVGIEPTVLVLETSGLPLTDPPTIF